MVVGGEPRLCPFAKAPSPPADDAPDRAPGPRRLSSLPRRALLHAILGAFAACTVHAQDSAHTHVQTAPGLAPEENAISDAVMGLLIRNLGSEDRLWHKVTGGPRLPTQSMRITVPGSGIRLGTLNYSPKVRFRVIHNADVLENCNGTAALKRTVDLYSTAKSDATWSAAKSDSSTASHSVSVTASVGDGFDGNWANNYLSSTYAFTQSNSTGSSSESVGSSGTSTAQQVSTNLVAKGGQSVVYQSESVAVYGRNADFVANATVLKGTRVNFTVITEGYSDPYDGMASRRYISALTNLPSWQGVDQGRDVELDNKVLVSTDGVYFFGRERSQPDASSEGIWSVVDAVRSRPGAVTRLWSPVPKNTCGIDLRLVMTRYGELQVRCMNKVLWDAGTSVRPGSDGVSRPCFYLTFINNGELACFDQDLGAISDSAKLASALNNPVFRSHAPGTPSQGRSILTQTRVYPFTLAEVLGGADQDYSFRFSGTFNGNQIVSGPTYCTITYNVEMKNGQCTRTGLANVDTVYPADGKDRNSGTRADQGLGKRMYCPRTQAFLEP